MKEKEMKTIGKWISEIVTEIKSYDMPDDKEKRDPAIKRFREEILRNTIEAKGMQATVVAFDSHGAGLAALESGEIDAYFGDQSILFGLFFASDLSESLVVSENTLTIEKHGLALPRGDTECRLARARAVSELYRTGSKGESSRTAFPGASPGIALQALFLLGPDMP
jgi:polar amino acid transport system substrate-binding protein/glutamate/aspartate transport system substrate-binding protein